MSAKKKSAKKKSAKVSKKDEAVSKKESNGIQPEPNDQDIQRRLGNFQGAGEPSRKGGRNGIVGQSSKKFKTDKKS
jgi:hypothetical protein